MFVSASVQDPTGRRVPLEPVVAAAELRPVLHGSATVALSRTLTSYNYAGADPINQSDPAGRSFGDFLKGAGKVLDGLNVATNCFGAFGGDASLTGCADTVGVIAVGVIVGAGCTATAGACILAGAAAGGIASGTLQTTRSLQRRSGYDLP